jgi:hypothetical protein
MTSGTRACLQETAGGGCGDCRLSRVGFAIPIDRAEAMLPQAQSTAMGQSQLATHPVQLSGPRSSDLRLSLTRRSAPQSQAWASLQAAHRVARVGASGPSRDDLALPQSLMAARHRPGDGRRGPVRVRAPPPRSRRPSRLYPPRCFQPRSRLIHPCRLRWLRRRHRRLPRSTLRVLRGGFFCDRGGEFATGLAIRPIASHARAPSLMGSRLKLELWKRTSRRRRT